MNILNTLFFNTSRQRALLTLSVASLLLAGIVIGKFEEARFRLANLKISDRSELSGAEFFVRPKTIFVYQQLSRKRLLDYGKSLGLNENNISLEGKNALRWISRKKEFKSAVFTFNKDRVASIWQIEPDGSILSVSEIEIESPVVSTYIWAVKRYGEANQEVSFAEAISKNPSRMCVRRRVVQAEDLNGSRLSYAIMAAENHSFNSDRSGISLKHMFLAIFQRRGGSTITQQCVKNFILLDASRTPSRKIDELFMTFALESTYDKANIFEFYANHIFFGNAADGYSLYGVGSAVEEFFGIKPENISSLSLSQSVTIAALIKRPNYFLGVTSENPKPSRTTIKYKELQERREYVLDQLAKYFGDVFSPEELEHARVEPVEFTFASQRDETRVEKAAQPYISENLAQNQEVNLYAPLTKLSGIKMYLLLDGEITIASYEILNKYLKTFEQENPAVDLVTGKIVKDDLLGSIVVLDPDSGQILALVGTQASRNMASLVKPLLVYLGLLKGIIKFDSVISYGNVTCRVEDCLASSKNELAYYLYERIGPKEFADFLEKLTGKRPEVQPKLPLGIGVNYTSLEIAKIYAAVVSGGQSPVIKTLLKAYSDGELIPLAESAQKKTVMNARFADETFDLMKGTISKGTLKDLPFSKLAVSNNLNIGAKTGSGFDYFTVSVQRGKSQKNLVVVVWVGYKSGRTKFLNSEKVVAAKITGKIWSDVMFAIYKHRPDLF